MFGYYLDLALCSLKRHPILAALMVLAIAQTVGRRRRYHRCFPEAAETGKITISLTPTSA